MSPSVRSVLATFLIAFGSCTPSPKIDSAAEEQAIRSLDTQFGAAAAKKDAEAGAALYAPDGAVMAPGAQIARGTEAIRALWTELVKTPGLSINIVPERVDIAAAGDFATDVGQAEFEMDTPQGHVKETSKYLEVWKKVDGKWKVLYDIWNSNTMPAPPAPAPASK